MYCLTYHLTTCCLVCVVSAETCLTQDLGGMEVDGLKPVAAVEPGTPLLRAVFLRRLRLTRLLLDGGAYVNESDGLGHTPLMVACTTRHEDSQSASRVKLVHFLLEKGADPNIQDKEGLSALMHACRERMEAEVVALLLASGADVGLEDQSGTSALVYAVMAGDWAILRLLLDTCKAKGKEVIIITTDQGPGGRLQAKQCMRVPPDGPPDQTTAAAAAAPAPASPSEIQLITSPQPTSSLRPPKSVFCFKESQSCGFSSHPCSPSRLQRLCQAEEQGQQQQQQHLLRLNSEPWLKIPQSLLKHHAASSASERSRDLSPAEDILLQIPKQDLNKTVRNAGLEGGPGGKKITLPGLQSPHSASHPNLCCVTLGVDPCRSTAAAPLHSMTLSSFHNIIQRRKLGLDIYSSDPQLARDAQNVPHDLQQRQREGAAVSVGGESRRLAPLRCSSTLSSAESPPNSGSNRKILSGFERRGSGAFLLEQGSQSRPRSLPPLALSSSNASVLNVYNSIGDKELGSKTFLPSAPPGHPKELGRRMLLRRHSIQPQQFKSTA